MYSYLSRGALAFLLSCFFKRHGFCVDVAHFRLQHGWWGLLCHCIQNKMDVSMSRMPRCERLLGEEWPPLCSMLSRAETQQSQVLLHRQALLPDVLQTPVGDSAERRKCSGTHTCAWRFCDEACRVCVHTLSENYTV